MSSNPTPTAPPAPATATPTKKGKEAPPLNAEEKGKLGGFLGSIGRAVGFKLLGKVIAKAPTPLRYVTAAIEIFKFAKPIVRNLLKGMESRPAPQPGKDPGSGPAAAAAARVGDPAFGEQLARLAQLGGISEIQRALKEGRLDPADPKALAEAYARGAQRAIEEGLTTAKGTLDRTGDIDRAVQQAAPSFADAKISGTDLQKLFDDRTPLAEKIEAATRVFEAFAKAAGVTIERGDEKATRPAEPITAPNVLQQAGAGIVSPEMARALVAIDGAFRERLQETWARMPSMPEPRGAEAPQLAAARQAVGIAAGDASRLPNGPDLSRSADRGTTRPDGESQARSTPAAPALPSSLEKALPPITQSPSPSR